MMAIDSSALLAYLYGEEGGSVVASALVDSCMSTVNLTEVIGKFVEHGMDANVAGGRLAASTIEFVPFTAYQAEVAAGLVVKAKPLGLSLADRACLALAIVKGVPVLSADRAWADLDVGVKVHLVR
jgi:PIN domain nuclease of toxin-antitoxin system